jgi:16S rRNA processing protein RimM
MAFLTIGKIVNVRGLKGEVKLQSLTDFASLRYQKGNTVYVEFEGKMIPVIVRVHHAAGHLDYVQFDGYSTVEAVTPWINAYVYAQKEAIALKKGQYFFSDLVDCSIINAQTMETEGRVAKVESYNGKNLLRMIRDGKPDVLIPFISPFIDHVDVSSKAIRVVFIEGML